MRRGKRALAEIVVRFVQRKIELGWLPWPGVLEYEEDYPDAHMHFASEASQTQVPEEGRF
jgi:hypothetical protein